MKVSRGGAEGGRHKGTGNLARTHFGAGEENRAKDAKDAKVKGMKDEEIAGVAAEWAFALR